MPYWGWAILIVANTPVYWLIGYALFNSWDDFLESVKYVFTPDILSMLRGEWEYDHWGTIRVAAWVLLSIGAVLVQWRVMTHLGWI